ncbi:TRAP transporter small permease [Roseobacter sinensis]|uniref:TRAP transporter small permease protein n=1 Tax=Roseobacter sinensis TaxID=2931391 RepID=A0ABT3BAS4_9RHOB|nr:TRAP transporter small permease [Roseobacter sp. WL0113]MCV3270686.1 TRAP transporter small permease [Roseobacter sp. WL0113]
MKRIERWIVTACSIGVGLSFLVLVFAVLVQVIGRGFGSSPVWTEELTRFAMLYTVAFGAGLAFRSGDLVNVDIVCERLPGAWPWRLRLLCGAATAGLCLYLIPAAWKYVSVGALQTSPALGVRMDLIHFSVFALLSTLAIFAVLRVIAMALCGDDGQPENRAET